MSENHAAPQQPPEPRPGPLVAPGPVNVAVGQFKPTGATDYLVALTCDTITGTHTIFLPPELAIQIARAMIANAQNAKTGLILPDTINLTDGQP